MNFSRTQFVMEAIANLLSPNPRELDLKIYWVDLQAITTAKILSFRGKSFQKREFSAVWPSKLLSPESLCAQNVGPFGREWVIQENKVYSNLKQEWNESLNLQYLCSFFHQHIIILQRNKNNIDTSLHTSRLRIPQARDSKIKFSFKNHHVCFEQDWGL